MHRLMSDFTVQRILFDIVSAKLEHVEMFVACFHLQRSERVDQLHQQQRLRVQLVKRRYLLEHFGIQWSQHNFSCICVRYSPGCQSSMGYKTHINISTIVSDHESQPN